MSVELKSITELLSKVLDPNEKIENVQTKRLLGPGENFTSVIWSLNVELKDTNTGKKKLLNAVAKVLPENKFLLKMNDISAKFAKEINIYQYVLPVLSEFQHEYSVQNVLTNIAPKFYGGFVETTENDEEKGFIILEDLRPFDYKLVEKSKGLNLECAKAVFRQLAKFHAVPIAMKIHQPDIFNQKIKPYLNNVKFFQPKNDKDIEWFIGMFQNLIESVPEVHQYRTKLEDIIRKWVKRTTEIVEPFGTLCHCDLWPNNILIKFNKDEPENIKLVDYQISEYNSFAKDLFIFLSVCVENYVLLNHYDDLLQFYYKHFTCTLERYGVNSNQFTYDGILKEIDRVAKSECIVQCFLMLYPIYLDPKVAVDVDKLDRDSYKKVDPSEQHKEKFKLLVKKCVEKNWI